MERQLSTSEIIENYKFPSKKIPLPDKKGLVPQNTEEENKQIVEYLNLMKQHLKEVRVNRRKQRCEAIWLPEKQLAKITRLVGNIIPQYGFSENNELFLTPDEALFLMEMNKLELLWNEIPFSIEQAYAVFFDTEEKLTKYRTFQELAFNGYRIKKNFEDTTSCSSTSSEYNNKNKSKKLKLETTDNTILFDRLKESGPKSFQLEKNNSSLLTVYLPTKQETSNIEIIAKPNQNDFSIETVSQDDSCILTSFTGAEALKFYQFHQVNLENN